MPCTLKQLLISLDFIIFMFKTDPRPRNIPIGMCRCLGLFRYVHIPLGMLLSLGIFLGLEKNQVLAGTLICLFLVSERTIFGLFWYMHIPRPLLSHAHTHTKDP